jgi:hypothetical protein
MLGKLANANPNQPASNFIDENGGGPSVRLRKKSQGKQRGDQRNFAAGLLRTNHVHCYRSGCRWVLPWLKGQTFPLRQPLIYSVIRLSGSF